MICRIKARSDAALLDWLDTWMPIITHTGAPRPWYVAAGEVWATGPTLRAAVGAAMDQMERADAGTLPAGCRTDCYGCAVPTERPQVGD